MPPETGFVLGDIHYNAPNVRAACEQEGRLLVTVRYGRNPHSDGGVEVRRLSHKLRSLAMENISAHFKGIRDGHSQVPTKGLLSAQRLAVGAIFVCQLALLYRFQQQLDPTSESKPF